MDFIHPDDFDKTRDISRRITAGERTTAFINRWLHRDGTVVPIMWSSAWSESRQVHYCIGRDMREHAAAEEKLRQAQKMEAIGRLTGGVAHDFNNLLTAVIGSAETLADNLTGRPDLLAIVGVTLDAASPCGPNWSASSLKALSRNQPLEPKAIDCASFLADLTPILQRTIGQSVSVVIEEAGVGLCCLADRNQLTSAVLNLVINARDAMPEGGADRSLGLSPANDQVALFVRDTGEGMDEATQARALEPFFTTKPLGQGSGLGLSMVYGFATQSGGRLEIDSVLGSGTEVRLFLPLADCAEAVCVADAPAPGLRASPKVVLVEDDDLVRGQVLLQLTALGCEVADFGPTPTRRSTPWPARVGSISLMTDISHAGRHERAPVGRPRSPVPSPPCRCCSPPATPTIRIARSALGGSVPGQALSAGGAGAKGR